MEYITKKLLIFSNAKDYFEKSTENNSIDILNKMLVLANKHGFNGNIWKSYVAYYIAMNENPFSLSVEKRSAENIGNIKILAKSDCAVLKKLFDSDISDILTDIPEDCIDALYNYDNKYELDQVGTKIEQLKVRLENALSETEFYETVLSFYVDEGVGAIGLNKAFVLKENSAKPVLTAIKSTDNVILSDLVGYEVQKKRLLDNTIAFIEGRSANNVLLYGDGGTGKSTSIRAICNQFSPKGLRVIQIYRHQMKYLNQLIDKLKGRNYKFIIYMDDLSFEDFETEYKYLKAIIEGGLEPRPKNLLIYATSNRRHLIKETWNDRDDMVQDGDMHQSDSMEEKLSLAERFGIQIYYGKPTVDEFHNIVETLAKRECIEVDMEFLHKEATKWEIRYGSVSGRSARQFIDYIKGMEETLK